MVVQAGRNSSVSCIRANFNTSSTLCANFVCQEITPSSATSIGAFSALGGGRCGGGRSGGGAASADRANGNTSVRVEDVTGSSALSTNALSSGRMLEAICDDSNALVRVSVITGVTHNNSGGSAVLGIGGTGRTSVILQVVADPVIGGSGPGVTSGTDGGTGTHSAVTSTSGALGGGGSGDVQEETISASENLSGGITSHAKASHTSTIGTRVVVPGVASLAGGSVGVALSAVSQG